MTDPRTPSGTTRALAVAVAVAALGLTACSSSGSSAPSSSPTARLRAAEPAVSPTTTTAPVGTSMAVGRRPQGIVYDPVTKQVAVAVMDPNRLLLLDPTTLAVRRTVNLPGNARHLQLGYGGGSVLVPAESAKQILDVSLTGKATTVADVLAQPHDAAQVANGDIVVGNELGKSISIVRGDSVLKTIADLTQPGGVIADGTTVGVVDVGAFTLSTYDLTTRTRTARVSAGAGPTHGLLISGNRMLVSDTRGNKILIFSVSPLKQVASLDLTGSPYGLAVDDRTGLVWVTLTALNQVVGLDVSGTTPKVIARYATARQPDTVAVAPGSRTLWVTGTAAGTVQRISR